MSGPAVLEAQRQVCELCGRIVTLDHAWHIQPQAAMPGGNQTAVSLMTAHAINLCVNGKQLPLRSDTLLSGICHHVWPPRTARGQWLLSAGQRPANIAARWAHAGPTGPLCHEKHLPPAAWSSEAAMPDLTRHWGRQGMLAAIPLMALPALHTCLVSNAGHTVDLC